MREAVTFDRLTGADLLAIDRQPSQRMAMGVTGAFTPEEAAVLASQPESWAVRRDGALIACLGIMETFPGAQGVAWAILASGIGASHLAISRFAKARIAGAGLARVEAVTRGPDADAIVAAMPGIDPGMLLAAIMATPTPECRWAALLGLAPAHVLRKFGGAGETHVLFERIAA